MTTPVIGIIVSALFVVLLSVLYRAEKTRGVRVFASARKSFDRGAVVLETSFEKTFRYIGREMPRQSLHYCFHTILVSALHFLKRCENGVMSALRSNRIMARKVKSERTSRNKLDEIAEHKAAIAMSEDEKKEHKEKMLEQQ